MGHEHQRPRAGRPLHPGGHVVNRGAQVAATPSGIGPRHTRGFDLRTEFERLELSEQELSNAGILLRAGRMWLAGDRAELLEGAQRGELIWRCARWHGRGRL